MLSPVILHGSCFEYDGACPSFAPYIVEGSFWVSGLLTGAIGVSFWGGAVSSVSLVLAVPSEDRQVVFELRSE